MFELIVNNQSKKYNDNDIEECLIEFNSLLSSENSQNINPNNDLSKVCIISVKSNDNIIKIMNNSGDEYKMNDVKLIKYFLFKKSVLDKINKINKNFHNKLEKLCPEILLDIFTSKKCLIDPYYVFIKIFKINENHIYQTFILYLNKTIRINDVIVKFDSDVIIDNFFSSNNYNNKTYINNHYEKLLLFYLKQKQIYPFMIKFNNYVSNLLD